MLLACLCPLRHIAVCLVTGSDNPNRNNSETFGLYLVDLVGILLRIGLAPLS